MEAGGLLPRQPPQGPPAQGPGSGCVGASAQQQQQVQGAGGGCVPGQPGELNVNGSQLGHQNQLQQLQMGQAPGMGEALTAKRQAERQAVVVDRLRRRLGGYRRRHTDCVPRYHQSFNGHVEQNNQDTQVLKQRFLESKAKRQAKKTDKKQNDPVGLASIHVVSHIITIFFSSFFV